MTENRQSSRAYITTIEAEKRSGLSRNYLALLLRRGALEGFRPSRDWFIYTDSLEQFLSQPRKSGPKGPHKKIQHINAGTLPTNAHGNNHKP
jgi:hypothetical protein